MASSDEEGEILPASVTNYYFVDDKNEPISFSILPLQWSEDEIPSGSNVQIFLCGTADSGQHIHMKVIAWKPKLSFVLPEIYALSNEKHLIKLRTPRRSFEDTIKTILITIRCLHFLKRNPETNGSVMWTHLRNTFSSYEVEPSESYLLGHVPLIKEAAVRDEDIAKSEYLSTFLLKISSNTEDYYEENHATKKSKFIVDMYDAGDDDNECDDSKDEIFDSVCSLCDNGGELLCCEDKCLRSFHPNVYAGADSSCESLGYNDAVVEAIQIFLCNNCQYQQHQCFVCGNLGSSDQSSIPEVFQCANATCGYFYHPKCVAALLHPCDKTKAEELELKIGSGESFACPAHKCSVCKKGEDKAVHELQFAMCRRCPKAYHRKCLPRKIAFESNANNNVQQRAWDGLLSDRILIYCMDHEMIPEIGTPKRNHIVFPNVDVKRQTTSGLLSSNEKIIKSKVFGNFTQISPVEKQKQVPMIGGAFRCGHSTSGSGVIMNSLRHNNTPAGAKVYRSSNIVKTKSSLDNLPRSQKYLPDSKQQNINPTAAKCVISQATGTKPVVDAEMKSRILKLMKDSTSSFNMEEFVKDQKKSSTYACSSRILEDKTFTEGKVEGYVKAVRAALKKLDEGGTLEDAKAVCEPQVLNQIVRWKRKLSVYLAPFLHGKRYTSFGRHFTKVDKLTKIVNRLKWYVQNGDTIVDFCCGSNDFSCLMKEKLDEMGKSCSFKNYDLFTPKNDFNFEQRNWMSVNVGELPAGSNLIMGLNPPFGVQASKANKFIDKALKFKPKLLILIVPKETERLDRKGAPYDIIWEDDQILSGKAFYLPGSVDVNDEQMEQWNLNAPPLYLWSHRDWTAKHKAIAYECGHLINKDVPIGTTMMFGGERNMKTRMNEISQMNMEENGDGRIMDMELAASPIYSPVNYAEYGGYLQQMNDGRFPMPPPPYPWPTETPHYFSTESFFPGGPGF